MVKNYFSMGLSGTGTALLAMVGMNLISQAGLVYVQTRNIKRNRWTTVIFEIGSVLTFLKPGVDAYRVASGAEKMHGAVRKRS
ncbi:hypothetical protein TeGR_g10071 [Tetraparma gracilis]|uniref:Uncharacterized protein n=1 Tax=Tetraparma gracilis TaxID=2962635 RepID=A0ABQ6MKN5_9STRA|nr:hypothetical protein TeGR_g10071 [Tetraparma gracilis]